MNREPVFDVDAGRVLRLARRTGLGAGETHVVRLDFAALLRAELPEFADDSRWAILELVDQLRERYRQDRARFFAEMILWILIFCVLASSCSAYSAIVEEPETQGNWAAFLQMGPRYHVNLDGEYIQTDVPCR